MKKILYLSIFILVSCTNEINIEHTYLEHREGKISSPKIKFDKYLFNAEGNMEYFSVFKNELTISRKWVFPNPENKIGERLEVGENEKRYLSTLIDKKHINLNGKTFEVIKYNIDKVLSYDEESNKIFVEGFGVIIETFWKRNKYQVVETNYSIEENETLKLIINELVNDERFIWSQNVKKKMNRG